MLLQVPELSITDLCMPRFRLDRALSLSPLSRLLRVGKGSGVPILMYHSVNSMVETRHPYYDTNISAVAFERQLQFLQREGYATAYVSDIVDALRNPRNVQKIVAITFDDGFRNFYTQAFPLLSKYACKATLFVPSGLVGKQRSSLGPEPFMTWNEIREVSRNGVRIGSHSVSHPDLYRLDSRSLEEEVRLSKTTIEDNIGEGVRSVRLSVCVSGTRPIFFSAIWSVAGASRLRQRCINGDWQSPPKSRPVHIAQASSQLARRFSLVRGKTERELRLAARAAVCTQGLEGSFLEPETNSDFHEVCARTMSLSIIIVNWNSAAYTIACIASIRAAAPRFAYEIIVVDNASSDDSADRLRQAPDIQLIRSTTNVGFARANNLGYQYSSGDVLLFLNPDTEVLGSAIDRMYDVLVSSENLGIVGCRLLNSDHTLQTSCVQAFPTILNQLTDIEALKIRFPGVRMWGISPSVSSPWQKLLRSKSCRALAS